MYRYPFCTQGPVCVYGAGDFDPSNCIGPAIEEDNAVLMHNGLHAVVLGTGTVIVMEGFEIKDSNIDEFAPEKPVTIRNLEMHILSSASSFRNPQLNPPHTSLADDVL